MGGGGLGAIINPVGTATKKVAGKRAGIVASPTGALAEETVVGPELDLPEIPGLPKAPGKDDAEVQAAKRKERKLSRLRRGRQSTILSNVRQQLSTGGQAGGTQLG